MAWWLFPLAMALYLLFLSLLSALPWAVVLGATGTMLLLGLWVRARQPWLKTHLWIATGFSAFVGFEAFGRLVVHLYLVLIRRGDLIVPASLALMAFFLALTSGRFQLDRRAIASGRLQTQTFFIGKEDVLDLAISRNDWRKTTLAGAVLAVAAAGAVKPLLQSGLWQTLALVGGPILVGTLFASALGRMGTLIATLSDMERTSGKRYRLPPLIFAH